jgi:two-component system, sensor histidine kinase YesM
MMERIRKLLLRARPAKIKDRFFIAMFLLSIPPLFVLGFISYNITRTTLVQNHVLSNIDHLKTANEVAELIFRNMVNVSRVILADSQLRQQLLESTTASEVDRNVIGVNTAERLQNVVASNLIDTKYIDSICLFDRSFRSVCYGRSENAGLYGSESTRLKIASTVWYRRTVEARGKEMFLSYDVLEESHSIGTFSIVKLLRDPTHIDGESIGLLVINIKKTMFDKVFNESANNGYLVMDSSDNEKDVVYATNPSELEGIVSGYNMDYALQKLQKGGYLITRYMNQTTGWTFTHVIKSKDLFKQSDQIGTATTIISLVIALMASLISLFVSGSVSRPLLQLKKMFVEWAKGTQNWNETFDADEVGVIGETFKRMAAENVLLGERLVHSQLKEREAELSTLQAQIKPHFLYNTLDSIYWMAVMKNNPEIAQMAISLSESFKLSLNKGKETISLSKELKHIEHYITIQNIRYNDRFQYVEDVDPDLKGMEILKLLLQPLVENAIYHGLEPKLGPGIVRLTGRIESGSTVVFTVEDDGVGISDIDAIDQGYGLGNVRERLKLYYGTTSLFQVTSVVNKGTIIEIRFDLSERWGGTDAESSRI